ncbi:hypothetical protein T08_14561 [Trichinella sp. T8]|nr:hypothetical protein T08_14561 [Trichinella sp. T8]
MCAFNTSDTRCHTVDRMQCGASQTSSKMHEFRDIFEVFPSVDRCIELIPEGLELENIFIKGWQLQDRPSCVENVVGLNVLATSLIRSMSTAQVTRPCSRASPCSNAVISRSNMDDEFLCGRWFDSGSEDQKMLVIFSVSNLKNSFVVDCIAVSNNNGMARENGSGGLRDGVFRVRVCSLLTRHSYLYLFLDLTPRLAT